MNATRMFVSTALLLLLVAVYPAAAQDMSWEWSSSDTSKLTVTMQAGDEFEWTNPDGSKIKFKAGSTPGERKMSFDDTETKAGKFVFPLGSLVKALANVDYGMGGEAALISTQGNIDSGAGMFTLGFTGGFVGFNDTTLPFQAHVVSNGSDNPIQFQIYGQGDQLRFPTPGTVSYSSKWTSNDSFQLSNGQTLALGNFLLVTTEHPSAFNYSVQPDGTFNSLFTITNSYLFVNDLNLPPTGSNLRFEMAGDSVTKAVTGHVVGPILQPGDANRDLQFGIQDIIQVLSQGKYNTGQAATWDQGDWNAAPGGTILSPPVGDGVFNVQDVIKALQTGLYQKGPYSDPAIVPLSVGAGGIVGDGTISIIYDPATGTVSIDAAGSFLTAFDVVSASGIFTGSAATGLGGPFDIDTDTEIAKVTFGSTFGSMSFGPVAARGLSEAFLLSDLTVSGALSPAGGFGGSVDLVYVPEPSVMVLLLAGAVVAACRPRYQRR